MGQAYAVTAEFYDLLQATEHLAVTGRLLDRWLGSPEVGVLDVGAGTDWPPTSWPAAAP
ncbi:hypothetical protein ACFQZ4_08155 [Catellatospora coxensis]